VPTETLENPEWQLNDTFFSNETDISITVEESTFLTFRANSNIECEPILWPFYPPYECRNPPGPGGGVMCLIESEPFDIKYGIVVLDCPYTCHIDDWTALKALYENTNNLSGNGWQATFSNQTEPPQECNLEEVAGITLNEEGRVRYILSTRNNITGSIPPEIGL